MVVTSLFEPITLGALHLPNRIVMSPLTRRRASKGRVPNALMADYYAQRSGAGLIVSEATSVSPQGVGYHGTPGIWSAEQIHGWKLVTDAVHAAGGRIVLQLWHVGRISDPELLDGQLPVAPSPIVASGRVRGMRPNGPTRSRAHSKRKKSHPSSRISAAALSTRRPRALTAWRFTQQTVT